MPLRLTVEGKPGSKSPALARRGTTLVVAVREPAIDGQANAAIVRAIAAWLDVGVSAVTIVHGGVGRRKYVDVAVDPGIVSARFAMLPER